LTAEEVYPGLAQWLETGIQVAGRFFGLNRGVQRCDSDHVHGLLKRGVQTSVHGPSVRRKGRLGFNTNQ
jgi:hypothetical protein